MARHRDSQIRRELTSLISPRRIRAVARVSFPGIPRHPARRVSSGNGHGSEDQIEAQEAPRTVQA